MLYCSVGLQYNKTAMKQNRTSIQKVTNWMDKLARHVTLICWLTPKKCWHINWTDKNACWFNKLCRRPPQYAPPPASWPLTLKVVSKSHVMRATSVPILVFLGLSVLDLGPMYMTDIRRASSLNAPYPRGGHKKQWSTVRQNERFIHRRLQ